MWGGGRLQVHEICSHRLMYSEEVEARSNYKKSYLWWFRNSACGDWTSTAQKMKFSIRIYPVNVTKSDLVTFIEEILNGKRHFFAQCGGNRAEKDQARVRLEFVCGKGEGEGVVWFRVCGAPWIGLILVPLMSFLYMMSMVLVLRGVGPILGNGYGI